MKIGSEGRGPPAGGQFRPVSRGGTSSVVAAYTGLSHSFRALEAYTAASCLCVNLSILRKFPQSVDTERGGFF